MKMRMCIIAGIIILLIVIIVPAGRSPYPFFNFPNSIILYLHPLSIWSFLRIYKVLLTILQSLRPTSRLHIQFFTTGVGAEKVARLHTKRRARPDVIWYRADMRWATNFASPFDFWYICTWPWEGKARVPAGLWFLPITWSWIEIQGPIGTMNYVSSVSALHVWCLTNGLRMTIWSLFTSLWYGHWTPLWPV
jgi:hypothetical protein